MVYRISVSNDHDLYFAEGYVEGSDRLFQLDLTRRYAYGRLAEVFGVKALALDEALRAVDIRGIAERQLHALSRRERETMLAFSEGVNASAGAQPLPVEFRMLLYQPAAWTPKDSLAVSVVASLELADSWHDVFARDAVWRQRGPRCFDTLFPLSDARYDVAIDGTRDARRPPARTSVCADASVAVSSQRHAIGSNAWAAGAQRTTDRDALVANDPHLDLTIPGIWYVIDIASPQLHAAGATIPGFPGVVLGHNEHLAWASTNASDGDDQRVRSGPPQSGVMGYEAVSRALFARREHAMLPTSRDFSVPMKRTQSRIALVRWPIYAQPRSTIGTVLSLDRARAVSEALRILENYPGSPQNFILADRSGKVAYHVAGLIPNDPAWGRYVHRARDLRETFAPLFFPELPGRNPSRGAILISANNKAYGSAYRYRLSAQFEPPYRAYRIAELLRLRRRTMPRILRGCSRHALPDRSRNRRDLAGLARTLPQHEPSAEAFALIRRWDGRDEPNSRGAALEHSLRVALYNDAPALNAGLIELRVAAEARAPELERNLGETFPFAFDERRVWRDAGRRESSIR